MCKAGDIILINNYFDAGQAIGRHSFVVLSDEAGQIRGLDYDIICNVMSSFKNAEQRRKKLSYPGNFEIKHTDSVVNNSNEKDGYIKAEQFYYFNKDKIDYTIIGYMTEEAFNLLIEFIEKLEVPITEVVDNL